MKRQLFLFAIAVSASLPCARAQTNLYTAPGVAPDSRFFELRTYHAAPGKLQALEERFRDHTNPIFTKHHMDIVGFWIPMDREQHYQNELIYMLGFASKSEHDKAWKEFAADPDWQKVRAESEKDGRLVEKVDSQYMTATDFSPIK